MIAVTLQNDLKSLFLFLLSHNYVIRFCNKSFGSKLKAHFFRFCLVSMIRMKSFGFELKAHFFSNFFCFELQSHFLNLIYIVQFQTLHS